MKKIAIMTWINNGNYGTMLQAYSLKKIIEEPTLTELVVNNFNFSPVECEFISYTNNTKHHNIKRKLRKIFKLSTYLNKLEMLIDRILKKKYDSNIIQRKELFDKFIKENLPLCDNKDFKDLKELSNIIYEYSTVVVGSDQVWNPNSLNEAYLLDWVGNGVKKISYASSLSVDSIPVESRKLYLPLCEFKYISIRDEKIKEDLEAIIKKEIFTVVDPVILLGGEYFKNKCFPINSKKYCFTYLLGSNIKHRKYFNKFCLMNNLNRISVIGVDNGATFSNKSIINCADFDVDPWKFISYIYNASFVITDSFHATVFSILFHKNFVVLEKDKRRKEQNNRILELLELVGLEDRWENYSEEIAELIIDENKWKEVDSKILTKRQYSLDFLLKALSD